MHVPFLKNLRGIFAFSSLVSWLFSFKYYTVSREIRFMFRAERQGSEASRRRKTMYRIIELSNLILLGITTLALLFVGTVGYGDEELDVVESIAVVLMFLQLPLNLGFLACSLCNFRSIVKGQEAVKVNTLQLHLHNVLIYLWSGFCLWVVALFVRDGRPGEGMAYAPSRDLLICDIAMLTLALLLSTLSAHVLYKANRGVPKR